MMDSIDFKSPTVQKIIIGLFLMIIIGIVWYTQSYAPKSKIIEEKTNTLSDKKLVLNNNKLKAKKLDQLRAERDSLFVKYRLLEHLLPSERDVPDFLNKLYISAANNGILVSKIDPQKSNETDFFYADPYNLELYTTYHKLGLFLSEVANFPFTTTASKLEMKSPNSSPDGNLDIKLSVTTYHINESERITDPEQFKNKTDKKPKDEKKK